MKKVAYVGIDYHINSVTIAVIIEGEKEFYNSTRLKNTDRNIKKYLKKLSKEFEVKACYEASASGYTLQRKMEAWGYHCDVIAPSLIPKKPGERRKNDFKDARKLAINYAQGNLTVVHLPTEEEESVRSLIRCRLSFKESLKRVKQQINAFVLGQGVRWPKSKWTHQHRTWLRELQMRDPYTQTVLDEYMGLMEILDIRIKSLEKQIEEIACSDIYSSSVKKLRAFKGIGTLTAMLLIAEITDFRRFPNPRALMAYLGLIPSEDSSGDRQKGGGITKAGNIRCRKYLIESIQHYIKKPRIGLQMKQDLQQVDPQSANIAIKCMHRLHKRFWSLVMRGKNPNKAKAAIAREFVGFIWAMMQTEPILS